MVVDDDETSAQCLALILRLEGYEVWVAPDGESASEISGAFRPGVLLSDIDLPGIDGHELARRLRRDGRPSAGLKLLVALTGHGGAESRRRSRESGFDHHLVKPVDPVVILALLESLQWQEDPVAVEPVGPP
jgi:CheY-like chemotaxis protein